MLIVQVPARDIHFMGFEGDRRPGQTTALVGVHGEVEQDIPGGPFGLRFAADVCYHRH
jgi:hypothetical protein